MEEGLVETDDYSLEAQLKDRATLQPIVDVQTALFGRQDPYLSPDIPRIQKTWADLIRVILSVKSGQKPSNEAIRAYQRNELGRARKESLLLELLPLPAPNVSYWDKYLSLFSIYRDREHYRDTLIPKRVLQLSHCLNYEPKLVVAYGTTFWSHYKDIFPQMTTWERNGVFEAGAHARTAVILMPHPVSRQMNGQRGALCEIAIRMAGVVKLASVTLSEGSA
jgi:hypothetical protein